MSGEKKVAFQPGAYPLLRIALIYAIGIVVGRLLAPDLPRETLAGFGHEPAFAEVNRSTSGKNRVTSENYRGGSAEGYGIADFSDGGISEFLFAGIALGVLFCLFASGHRRRASPEVSGIAINPNTISAIYLLCIFGIGILQSYIHHLPHAPNELMLQVFEPQEITFHGVVRSDRATRSGNRMLTVDVDSASLHGLPTWKIPFRTEVLIHAERTSFEERTSLAGKSDEANLFPVTGAYLRFQGDLQPTPRPQNPNQFDYAAFLSRRDIYCQVIATQVTDYLFEGQASFWTRQQVRIRSALIPLFSSDNSGLARAIILGDRSDLGADMRTGFSRAGLAHLMAVSGMHVGFILLPVWVILPWFRRTLFLRYTGLALGGCLLLFYAGITGFSVSVSRASLMAFLMMLARLFHKPGTSMNILGAAALLLLLHDPLMLFDVGFQLSFIAVIIILTTLPGTRYLLPPHHRYRKTGALFQFVMVSVLVQGGLYPLLIHYFQEFSIAGPLSNTLAVPFVQIMFLWSFLCLGLSLFHESFAVLVNTPGDLILTALSEYVAWISAHPGSWIEGTLSGPQIFGIWFFGTAFLASIRMPDIRFKMVAGLLFFLVLLQADRVVNRLQDPHLHVSFFDVGQGDAVLLQTPGGLYYLYDTGVWSPGFDSADRTILPELKAMGIRKLDGVILSHPHADHIGGIVSLMNHIVIDTIYQSPATYDSRLYHRYMTLALEKEIPVRLLKSGDMILTDPSMPMLALAPSSDIKALDPNNQSVVLMVLYGRTRLLLTGDAEKEAEAFLVERYGDFLKADLLKIGHHASRTSSTKPFLQKVRAPTGVASLGLRNRYQHPHPEATKRLNNTGVATRFTSLEGAIIYKSDGVEYVSVPW